jgi:aspartate-semialdehyde dehydrogenase
VALIGPVGIVGQEVIQLMEERGFPLRELTPLGTVETEGTRVECGGHRAVVRAVTKEAFAGVDLAIFMADADQSRDYAPHAVEAGAVVIDCSGAFSQDPYIPLCVPEVNAAVLAQHRGLVAVPQSMSVQLALVLAPLHAEVPLKRVVISTYQSVSGMGRPAMQEFDQQMRDLLNFRPAQTETFPHQLAFNCLPQCGDFLDNGYTSEEMALVEELRRLLGVAALPISATAVQVPLMHGHAATVYVETADPASPDRIRDVLQGAPGVRVQDDPRRLLYPLPVQVNGQDDVCVGRIRADLAVAQGIQMWVVADNLRRGMALNVVQVAEVLTQGGR